MECGNVVGEGQGVSSISSLGHPSGSQPCYSGSSDISLFERGFEG